jgi:hypothetical protein
LLFELLQLILGKITHDVGLTGENLRPYSAESFRTGRSSSTGITRRRRGSNHTARVSALGDYGHILSPFWNKRCRLALRYARFALWYGWPARRRLRLLSELLPYLLYLLCTLQYALARAEQRAAPYILPRLPGQLRLGKIDIGLTHELRRFLFSVRYCGYRIHSALPGGLRNDIESGSLIQNNPVGCYRCTLLPHKASGGALYLRSLLPPLST